MTKQEAIDTLIHIQMYITVNHREDELWLKDILSSLVDIIKWIKKGKDNE